MRFLLWTTPYGDQRRDEIVAEFGLDHYNRARNVILHSIKSTTLVGYAAGLLRLNQWADEVKLPEERRMPISDRDIAMFAAAQAGKAAACDSWIDGIKFFHEINFAPWLGGDLLARMSKGFSHFAPESSKRPPRPPVTLEHIDALHAGIDFSKPDEAAAFACAATAFWTCSRLGELLPVGEFNPYFHVDRGALDLFAASKARNEMFSVVFKIPYDKVNGNKGALIQILNHPVQTSALAALYRHKHVVNAGLPDSAPLFAYSDGAGGWRALTKMRLMSICDRIWKAAGLVSIAYGHSFRIGGATELLLRGVHPDMVMRQGRWLSRAFLTYWRRIQEVLPMFFLTEAFSPASEARLGKSMADFEKLNAPAATESARSRVAKAKNSAKAKASSARRSTTAH
ncbi:DNA breaking-rejoining enzyme [Peniophora sp. CONT]|nr:DNA breaking-rejoining enzyme [Peniophora sp. CONT]